MEFIFHNPTKILFGKDQELQVGDELRAAGHARVLLVYGCGSVQRSGLLARVTGILNDKGVGWIEFGGVVSNPVLSHTRQGIELARREKVTAVLAVGGGSVLDEAKAIAVGAMSDVDVWEYFTGREVEKALPVFAILTLAATGSEMNGNSVVTNEETKQKFNISSPHVYPKVSILNPELTHTVPSDYTAYSAVDAIAHVLEGYCTKQTETVLQSRLVESIIKTVMETTDIILREPDNGPARAQFMWSATLALNGLTTAGIGEYSFPNHMIEHSLSAIYNIPHGAGLSIVIPAWMKWYREKNIGQFERFSREILGMSTVDEGIAALEQWFAVIGSPTRLRNVSIPDTDIDEIAANAEDLAHRWGIGETYSRSVIADILRLAI